jgi:hypothetical protein
VEQSKIKTKKVEVSLASPLKVHEVFLSKEFVFRFAVVRVVYAAVNWANSSTLRLIVKTNTFGAFLV